MHVSVAVLAQHRPQGPLEHLVQKDAALHAAHSDGRRSLLICRFYLRPAAVQDENQIFAGGGQDLQLRQVDRCHFISAVFTAKTAAASPCGTAAAAAKKKQ